MNFKLKNNLAFIKSNLNNLKLSFKKNKSEKTFIFHHIPRSAGTSFRKIFNNNLIFYKYYRVGWSNLYPLKPNLKKLGKNDCLSGHFETENHFLFQIYPEILNDNRYFLFSFIRNPLDIKLSNFFYSDKYNDSSKDLISYLLNHHPNYIAHVLNVNNENYKEIIDRYDFIGIFENYQESIQILSNLMGFQNITDKKTNSVERDSRINKIDDQTLESFKKINQLDYLIYDYCLAKYEDLKIKYNIEKD